MKILTIDSKTARVTLDDTVDEWSRKELAKEMKRAFGADALTNPEFAALTASADSNEIDRMEIMINSPGGSVFDGMLIFNELKAMRARGVHVTAIVNVLAASMGSVIAMAADEVQIAPNGRMMIHDASAGARGNAKDMSRMAKLLESISNEIAGIYASKTGKTVAEMREMMLAETWLDADQCIAVGLADGLFDFRAEAGTLPSMSYLARLTNPAQPEALEKIQSLETTIADHEATINELTGKLETAETALQDAATLKAELGEVSAKLEAANDDLAAMDATIADMQAKADAAEIAHAEALANAEASVSKLAAEIAASAGVSTPLQIAGQAQVTDHLAVMANLKGAERTEYFKNHEAEIMAAMTK